MSKKVLVTGASRGIGLEIATVLAQQDCGLAMTARSAAIHDQATRLSALGQGSVVGLRADLAKREDVEALPE
ncbi:MAG: SDR family NAD(P)-dependent oxidoreductase, partial [Algiphilus sp.]